MFPTGSSVFIYRRSEERVRNRAGEEMQKTNQRREREAGCDEAEVSDEENELGKTVPCVLDRKMHTFTPDFF